MGFCCLIELWSWKTPGTTWNLISSQIVLSSIKALFSSLSQSHTSFYIREILSLIPFCFLALEITSVTDRVWKNQENLGERKWKPRGSTEKTLEKLRSSACQRNKGKVLGYESECWSKRLLAVVSRKAAAAPSFLDFRPVFRAQTFLKCLTLQHKELYL